MSSIPTWSFADQLGGTIYKPIQIRNNSPAILSDSLKAIGIMPVT